MAFDGASLAAAATAAAVSCSSLIVEEGDMGYGFIDLGLYQLAATTSIPCGPEAGATAIYQGESNGSHGASPAASDTKLSKRRRKARMNEVDEETQSRRRAQNRESQQAYRHRREDYIQNLQNRIVDLHLRHRDLWQSYYLQDRRLGLLKEMAADLTMEVTVLRRRQPQQQGQEQEQEQQQQQQQQLASDEILDLEGKGDCTIVSNDQIYPDCVRSSVDVEVEASPNLGQGFQEWLSGSTPMYSPCHTSEYLDLH